MKVEIKFALFILLLVVSCHQDKDSIPPPNYGGGGGSINYSAICSRDIDNNGNIIQYISYDGNGDFFSNTSYGKVDVGTLFIGNVKLVTDIVNTGDYIYRFSTANRNDSNNAFQFGTNVIFKISGGNNYDPVSRILYVPKTIFLDTVRPAYPNLFAEISLSNLPYRIKWNADPVNTRGVGLNIKYNGPMSRKINPTLSDTTFTMTIPNLPDNGYYDITAADLANIPNGGIIDIFIGRSNWGIMVSNGQSINITANTNSTRSYMLVP